MIIQPLPLHILSCGKYGAVGNMTTFTNGGFSSSAWNANNRAVYYPVRLPLPFTVARFMVANAANVTGNADVGLYDTNGKLIVSTGTTPRANTNTVQYISVTAKALPAGDYYIALVCSSTTGRVMAANLPVATETQSCGILQEDLGSTVLPSTMTPARYTSVSAWHFGFTQSSTL